MLLRILALNPGYTFTRHLGDAKFLSTIKDLLRNGRDPSVWQILGETLDYFSQDPERVADEGLQPLRELWIREKTKRPHIQLQATSPQAQEEYQQQPPMMPPRAGSSYSAPSARPHLPPPTELAARISEANTSAKLLTQLVQSTPQAEVPDNALIREFADRCKLAARSMHAYIAAEEPAPPDADTLTTLIETNDVISIALEGHRKAVAAALREREQFAAVGNARVGDVGEVPMSPVMHGARDARERRGSSPVSPMVSSCSCSYLSSCCEQANSGYADTHCTAAAGKYWGFQVLIGGWGCEECLAILAMVRSAVLGFGFSCTGRIDRYTYGTMSDLM